MKNLKMLLAALSLTALSFLTGCSDQITSTGESMSGNMENSGISQAERQIDRPLFKTQIRLKPFRSYTFNLSNTGLNLFNSVKAERIYSAADDDIFNDPCKDLRIIGSSNEKVELSCNSSSKLDLKEVTVVNTGSSMFDVDVVLTGKINGVNGSK
ncbi:MAG: hypothetical protein IPL53_14070 [Ignavibacteria bacterium]|nr:hypothetical protein [Ignavibacteria bacterium]